MALFLTSININLIAQELVTIIQQVNRFHILNREAANDVDTTTGILLALNQILNPREFEATVTIHGTIIMVLMD